VYLTSFHAIEEKLLAIEAGGERPEALLMAKPGPRCRELASLASRLKVRVERTGSFELDRLAPGNRGVALEVREGKQSALDGPETTLEEFLASLEEGQGALVVILDAITDPHNWGAILRSCDQFGVDLVLSGQRRNAKNAATAASASAGASAWVKAASEPNLARAAKRLKEAGFWVYGADAEGEPLPKQRLAPRAALVFGAEGAGLSRLLREQCDCLLSIPTQGRLDSLNVSVAAGIFLYEARRGTNAL